MRCAYCGFEESKVFDSRPVEDSASIRRRRECLRCEKRFTTYERIELVPLIVVKRDGRREPFDRTKILAGLLRARGKRPVATERLEALAADIERALRLRGEAEVPSSEIGEQVVERLRPLDEIAFVRFASEYRRFGDADSLVEEVERLRAQKQREELHLKQIPLLPADTKVSGRH
ncbi:MAG: transcriptional repressor NrdR [Armatimonadetes bacterium]|nr:transcriptional repressor NrdR [Armatimonadota bacterium]